MALPLPESLRAYLHTNKPKLNDLTNCNSVLLVEMVAKRVFTEHDKQEVESKRTPFSQASEFYDIISRKTLAKYKSAVKALDTCGQCGAATLLNEGLNPEERVELHPRQPEDEQSQGTICITSVTPGEQQTFRPLQSKMALEEAVNFVKRELTKRNDLKWQNSDIITLVETLQRNQLPLEQAVAYIRNDLHQSKQPVQKYLDLFKAEKAEIKKRNGYKSWTKDERVQLIIWNLVVNAAVKTDYGIFAIRMMNLISYFKPRNIPVRLFENFLFTDRQNVNSSVDFLKKYFLISGELALIHVHPTTQYIVRLNAPFMDSVRGDFESDAKSVLTTGLKLLGKYLEQDLSENEVQILLPHAETVWNTGLTHLELMSGFANFPSLLCAKLHQYNLYRDSIRIIAEKSLPKMEQHSRNWSVQIGVLNLKFRLAEAKFHSRKYSESWEIVKDIEPIVQNHPAIRRDDDLSLEIQHLYALNLDQQGKYGEAIGIYKTIKEIHRSHYNQKVQKIRNHINESIARLNERNQGATVEQNDSPTVPPSGE